MKDNKPSWSLPVELKAQIHKSNNPTQEDIDALQFRRIGQLHDHNLAQDKQLLVTVILGTIYLVWLVALTGWMVYE